MSSEASADRAIGDLFAEFFSGGKVANGAVAVELALTPAELTGGAVKRIEISHPGECGVCEPRTCAACEGRGVLEQRQGFLTIQRSCECAGGQLFDRHCPACHGTGAAVDVVEVTVPPGSEAGAVLSIAGEGDRAGDQRGDLLVHLAVAGVDVPRASVHQSGSSDVLRFAAVLALVLAVAAVVSQIW